jgi:hypothetical protein
MESADLEWDGMTPQPPRSASAYDSYDSISTSSESSKTISETRSLLGKDNNQVVNYGTTDIPEGEPDAIAESDGISELQHTPSAIAAVISVLLVGEDLLSTSR